MNERQWPSSKGRLLSFFSFFLYHLIITLSHTFALKARLCKHIRLPLDPPLYVAFFSLENVILTPPRVASPCQSNRMLKFYGGACPARSGDGNGDGDGENVGDGQLYDIFLKWGP